MLPVSKFTKLPISFHITKSIEFFILGVASTAPPNPEEDEELNFVLSKTTHSYFPQNTAPNGSLQLRNLCTHSEHLFIYEDIHMLRGDITKPNYWFRWIHKTPGTAVFTSVQVLILEGSVIQPLEVGTCYMLKNEDG